MIFLFPRWDMLIPWRVFFSWSPSAGRDLWFLERRLRRIRPPRTRWDHAFAVGCSLERKRMEHRGVQIFLGGLFFFLPEWNLWMSSILVVEPSKTRSTYHSKQGSSKRFQAGVGLLFFGGGVFLIGTCLRDIFAFFEIFKKEQTQSSSTSKIRSQGRHANKIKEREWNMDLLPCLFPSRYEDFPLFLDQTGVQRRFCELSNMLLW